MAAERVSDTIKEVELNGDVKVLKSEKAEYQGRNVIIATGAHARPIGCKARRNSLAREYPTARPATPTSLRTLKFMW